MPGGILYAVVARGTVVLAEYNMVQGNASLVALQLLDKLPPPSDVQSRSSYVASNHVFHILASGGIAYLCMAEEAFGRRLPFAFLESIQSDFTLRHGAVAATAVAYEFNSSFDAVLHEHAERFSNPRADAVGRVRVEVAGLRDVMVDNIEKVLERGERLELLVRKTDDLSEGAFVFKRGAQRLRAQGWWRSARTTALIVGLVALAVYLLAAAICSPTLHC